MEHLRGPLHKFAMALFGACRKQTTEGNMLFSPMTASTGLLIVMSGAGGTTKAEMEAGLYISDVPTFQRDTAEQDVQMAFRRVLASLSRAAADADERRNSCEEDLGLFQVFRVNKLFVQEGVYLTDEFLEVVKKLKGEIEFVDFRANPNATLVSINAYVERAMNYHIKSCFTSGSITKSSQIVLANGICFRARWETFFDLKKTTMRPFHQENKKVVGTAMMHGVFQLPYYDDHDMDLTYLEIPYVHNAASFLILLPKKKNGLQDLQRNLTPAAINRMNLSKRMKEVAVWLPKFQILTTFDMKAALQKIGIKEVFSDQADLHRMSPSRPCLSAASHTGYLGIDEKGTDVAACGDSLPETTKAQRRVVTSLSGTPLDPSSSDKDRQGSKSIKLEVNHPFLFSVRHNKSGLMVCLGRLESVSL